MVGELSTHSIEWSRLLPVMKLDMKRKFERERDAASRQARTWGR